jgi:hypothetical protein
MKAISRSPFSTSSILRRIGLVDVQRQPGHSLPLWREDSTPGQNADDGNALATTVVVFWGSCNSEVMALSERV